MSQVRSQGRVKGACWHLSHLTPAAPYTGSTLATVSVFLPRQVINELDTKKRNAMADTWQKVRRPGYRTTQPRAARSTPGTCLGIGLEPGTNCSSRGHTAECGQACASAAVCVCIASTAVACLQWSQVNASFGSIFSTLLPGTEAKLEPPEGQTFEAGGLVLLLGTAHHMWMTI